MLKVKFKGISDVSRNIRRVLEKTNLENAAMADSVVKSKTPIRSGNARSKWKKRVMKTGFELSNRVSYIERLENNWSKQTRGKGIIQPSIKEIKRKLK